MALIKCTECGKEISENAVACPNCGNPINPQQTMVVVRKDYKAKAKALTITGIIVFILSCIIGISTVGDMVGLKAKYLTGGGGPYQLYSFLIDAFTWCGIIILAIGIIYWIIYAANKK